MPYKKSEIARQAILSAAAALFRERGYENVNMLDISKSAGISRASLYYYYDNKFSIADHLVDLFSQRIEKFLQLREEKKEDPFVTVIVLAYATLKIMIENDPALPFADIIDYTRYGKEQLNYLGAHHSFPCSWQVFEKYGGKALTQKEKHTFILMSNAITRTLCRSITSGQLDYSLEDALGYFFQMFYLRPLNLPEKLYREKYREAVAVAEENQELLRF